MGPVVALVPHDPVLGFSVLVVHGVAARHIPGPAGDGLADRYGGVAVGAFLFIPKPDAQPVPEAVSGGKAIPVGIVGAIAAAGLKFQLLRCLGDDVDDTAHGISAVKRRGRAANHLNPLDVLHRKRTPLHAAGVGVVEGLSVDQDQRIFIAGKSAHADRRSGIHKPL